MKLLKSLMIWTGGCALCAAMLLNVAAVAGRHAGLPFKGASELVQAAVLIAGSLALIAATAAKSHARVHLLLDRLSPANRPIADRISAGLAILFYTGLLAGAGWVAADLWNAQEVSEIMGVPWRWMRAFANAALLVILLLLGRQLIERVR